MKYPKLMESKSTGAIAIITGEQVGISGISTYCGIILKTAERRGTIGGLLLVAGEYHTNLNKEAFSIYYGDLVINNKGIQFVGD